MIFENEPYYAPHIFPFLSSPGWGLEAPLKEAPKRSDGALTGLGRALRFSSFQFDGVLGLGLPSLSQTSEFNFLEAAFFFSLFFFVVVVIL